MKHRFNPFLLVAALAACAPITATRADVLNINGTTNNYGTLLTDDFNTPSFGASTFNNNLGTDQNGLLGTVSYAVAAPTGDWNAQHSNSNAMLLCGFSGGAGAWASLNRNFATDANAAGVPLVLQFDAAVTDGVPWSWLGGGIGPGQGTSFYDQPFGVNVLGSAYQNYKFVISDTAGTGSAFNGTANGAKVDYYVNSVFQGSTTRTLGAGDGYITFQQDQWDGFSIGHVDNLVIRNGQQTNPLPTSTELNLTGGGILNLADATQTVAKLDGASGTAVNLVPVAATSSLIVNGGADSTFGGSITGTGGCLTKSGVGTLTLSGANTYTGTTTVNGGKLLVNGSLTGGGTVTVASGGTLGGTGSISGPAIVNGVLSPGASIESLTTGALTFNGGSSFVYEMDSGAAAAVAADLQQVFGDLTLSGTVTLALTDMASVPSPFALGTTLSLINYAGTWNGGFFTYDGSSLPNNTTFAAGLNIWRINYDAISGGLNFASEYTAGHFVTLTAVPEPASWLALGCLLGSGTLLRRRSRL